MLEVCKQASAEKMGSPLIERVVSVNLHTQKAIMQLREALGQLLVTQASL